MRFRIAVAAALLGAASFGCGSSYSPPASPTPTPTTGSGSPVSIVSGASTKASSAYAPNPITVAVGGSVTWMNNDSTSHTSTADGGAWSSGTIGPGASYTKQFSSAGTFTYHCSIHPGMVGSVVVQ